MLLRLQVVTMTAHQAQQTPMLCSHRIQFLPASQEVMVDDADHMETIGHDSGLGKVLSDQRAIHAGQIHAHHFHQLLALQFFQPGFQRRFAAPGHHVVNAVIPQIAEGGGVTQLAREEVLVDSQNGWTHRTGPFCGKAAQIVAEPAFHSGAGEALALPQPAAADAIVVLLTNAAPEWFAGSQPRQNAGEALPETAFAAQTSPLPAFQLQPAVPHSPAFMARSPQPPILQPKLLPFTMWAPAAACVPHPQPHFSRYLFDACNLVVRQAYYRL